MDSLVSTGWLEENRNLRGLIVLDASKHLPDAGRDARAEFETEHIVGARFLNMPSFHDPSAPVSNTMPHPEQVAKQLAALGITSNDTIILYDDSVIKSAARAWFIIRESGLDKVAILNGGLTKWKAEGRPLESGSTPCGPAPVASVTTPQHLRNKAAMLANITKQSEHVIDARDAARFEGREPDSGHIPGSTNLWFKELFAEDGTYKPAEQLRALFAQAGVTAGKSVITTCNSGMTAAVLLFALHLTGHDNAALYDGSWSEWGADPHTPKITGSIS